MDEQQAINQARDAVKAILDTLQIKRVVCVDDTYVKGSSVEDVIVAAGRLANADLKKAFPEIGDSIPEDQDILAEQIRRLWDDLDPTLRLERAKSILTTERLQGDEDSDDAGDASILKELIPDKILIELPPKQWEESREKFLKEDAEKHTLFLFDQDLSEDDGDVAGGIHIFSSLLSRDDTRDLICCLLTHTVTPDNQYEKWMD